MSHHSNNPFESEEDRLKRLMGDMSVDIDLRRNKIMRSLADATGFRGALGNFPDGKMKQDDEGAIQFAIGSEGDKVIIDFGTSVKWVGMTPQQAADFASTLLTEARKLGRKQGETITLMIEGANQ